MFSIENSGVILVNASWICSEVTRDVGKRGPHPTSDGNEASVSEPEYKDAIAAFPVMVFVSLWRSGESEFKFFAIKYIDVSQDGTKFETWPPAI